MDNAIDNPRPRIYNVFLMSHTTHRSLCPFTVHPIIQVPNQLVGAPIGKDVTLVCNVEASPRAINYWQKDNGKWGGEGNGGGNGTMFLVTLSFQNRVTARAGGRSRRSSNEGINDLELHAEEESNRWWLLKHQFIRSEM